MYRFVNIILYKSTSIAFSKRLKLPFISLHSALLFHLVIPLRPHRPPLSHLHWQIVSTLALCPLPSVLPSCPFLRLDILLSVCQFLPLLSPMALLPPLPLPPHAMEPPMYSVQPFYCFLTISILFKHPPLAFCPLSPPLPLRHLHSPSAVHPFIPVYPIYPPFSLGLSRFAFSSPIYPFRHLHPVHPVHFCPAHAFQLFRADTFLPPLPPPSTPCTSSIHLLTISFYLFHPLPPFAPPPSSFSTPPIPPTPPTASSFFCRVERLRG